MKSEKAKQFLETKQPGDIAQYEISRGKAEKAVEIAEAEMRERAIEAFRFACSTRRKCLWCVENTLCPTTELFIQQLDKQKQE